MKYRLLSLAAATAAVFSAPVAAQTVLTTSTWVPPGHAITLAQKEWCDLVEKNSNKRIRCNHLPRAVAAPPGTFDAVKNGLADVSFTVHGYTPGRFVHTQMAEFPFLGDSAENVSVAFNRVAFRNPEFLKEHEGVKVLAFFTHGPGIVFNTKRPVTKLEDLQGLKWRVGGGMVNEISKTLGMNVTLKPAPESYELLSGGVMDGTLFPAESIEAFKIDKLIKHATVFPGGLYNTSFVFMMNPAKYNAMSAEDKKVVDAASGEVAARMLGRSWDKFDRRAYGIMQANNVQIVKADAKFIADVKSRTSALEQKWVQESKAKGLGDPAKLLADFRAEIAKLSK
jgi:TRAP-type C4-dicarboxylate transport system substrate-binding protein